MIIKTNKTFYDIEKFPLNSNSLLNQFEILQVIENKEHFLNIWQNFEIINKSKEKFMYFYEYIVEERDFWENIAYKVYKNEKFWWIIALFNDVINPFEELITGNKIYILKEEFIPQLLREIKKII